MKKLASIALLVGMSTTAMAQSTSTGTSVGDIRKALKKSPFSLAVDNTTESNKSGTEYVGVVNWLVPMLSYKLSKNDSLRLMPELQTVTDNTEGKTSDEKVETDLNYVEFRYKRANILTEADNGVNLWGEFRVRPYVDGNVRLGTNRQGNIQPRVGISKQFTKNFNFTTIGRLDNYIARESEKNYRERRFVGYILPSYTINEKLSTGVNFYYVKKWESQEAVTNGENFDAEPFVSYQLSKDVGATLYAGNTLMQSYDGNTFNDDRILGKAYVGLTLSLKAF